MKIRLSCGDVEIKPLPIYADKAIDLLNHINSMGSKDNAFPAQRDLMVDILYYSEPRVVAEQINMGDMLMLISLYPNIIASALPMPEQSMEARMKAAMPGEEVISDGDGADKFLSAAGVISGRKAEGKA